MSIFYCQYELESTNYLTFDKNFKNTKIFLVVHCPLQKTKVRLKKLHPELYANLFYSIMYYLLLFIDFNNPIVKCMLEKKFDQLNEQKYYTYFIIQKIFIFRC